MAISLLALHYAVLNRFGVQSVNSGCILVAHTGSHLQITA